MSLFLVIAGCAGFLILLNTVTNSIGNKGIAIINAQTAQEMINDPEVTVIDVRTPGEYQGGHLKQAKLLPVAELSGRLDEISSLKASPILVYCRSGHRSSAAARILKKAGFSKISNLSGGITAWRDAGGAVTKK